METKNNVSLAQERIKFRRDFFKFLAEKNKEQKGKVLVYELGSHFNSAFVIYERIRMERLLTLKDGIKALKNIKELFATMEPFKQKGVERKSDERIDSFVQIYEKVSSKKEMNFKTEIDISYMYWDTIQNIEPEDLLNSFYELFIESADSDGSIQNEFRLTRMF